MDPTFRAGFLRQAAINRLQQLEEIHGESIAFEILGPPRMSKLLYESFMLKRAYQTLRAATQPKPEELAEKLKADIMDDTALRQQIISIGLPILLPDGESLLRGPIMKSVNAHSGWVDLTPQNMAKWQERLTAIREMLDEQLSGDTSSTHDRAYPTLRDWLPNDDSFHIGEITAWVAANEDAGRRGKG